VRSERVVFGALSRRVRGYDSGAHALGARALEVAGVYTDYGDDQGVVMVDRVHAQEWFGTQEVSTLLWRWGRGRRPML
jgi:hypothetical protein